MPSQAPLALRRSRALGALLALHGGDSLGASFEFEQHEAILRRHPSPRTMGDIVGGGVFDWPAGHATDDTDLTRAVLLAYVDRHRHRQRDGAAFSIARAAGTHMLAWLSGPPAWPDDSRGAGDMPRDIGGATMTGLGRLKARLTSEPGFDAGAEGSVGATGAGRGQAGNGSLMRCLATGLFETDEDRIVADASAVSAITHDDVRCTVACAAYCVMVRRLMDRAADDAAGRRKEAAVWACVEEGLEVARRLEAASSSASPSTSPGPVEAAIELGTRLSLADLAADGPRPALPGRAAGYVLESLSLGVAAVLDPRGIRDVLVDVVRVGKDTDTNAAVAGGLLGARDGAEGVPPDWRAVPLQFGAEFEKIVVELLPDV